MKKNYKIILLFCLLLGQIFLVLLQRENIFVEG